jgi:hypothetical protein
VKTTLILAANVLLKMLDLIITMIRKRQKDKQTYVENVVINPDTSKFFQEWTNAHRKTSGRRRVSKSHEN